jgi:hypothetical protein
VSVYWAPWFVAGTPFTNVSGRDVGTRGNERPMGFETSCDAGEAVLKMTDNAEIVNRLLEIPNYLETVLINLTVALQVSHSSSDVFLSPVSRHLKTTSERIFFKVTINFTDTSPKVSDYVYECIAKLNNNQRRNSLQLCKQ